MSPLHHVIQFVDADNIGAAKRAVTLLVQAQANMSLTNNVGRLPIDLATNDELRAHVAATMRTAGSTTTNNATSTSSSSSTSVGSAVKLKPDVPARSMVN